MKFNELSIQQNKTGKRVGRGIASGKGKTAGRGTKGQGARTGSSKRPGFEGGQNPLMQRLPKLPGFRSLHIKSEVVLAGQLEQFAGKTVDTEALYKSGLISSPFVKVKLLVGEGDLTKKVTVKLQAASVNAIAIVQQAGGTFEAVARAQQPKAKSTTDNQKK